VDNRVLEKVCGRWIDPEDRSLDQPREDRDSANGVEHLDKTVPLDGISVKYGERASFFSRNTGHAQVSLNYWRRKVLFELLWTKGVRFVRDRIVV